MKVRNSSILMVSAALLVLSVVISRMAANWTSQETTPTTPMLVYGVAPTYGDNCEQQRASDIYPIETARLLQQAAFRCGHYDDWLAEIGEQL